MFKSFLWRIVQTKLFFQGFREEKFQMVIFCSRITRLSRNTFLHMTFLEIKLKGWRCLKFQTSSCVTQGFCMGNRAVLCIARDELAQIHLTLWTAFPAWNFENTCMAFEIVFHMRRTWVTEWNSLWSLERIPNLVSSCLIEFFVRERFLPFVHTSPADAVFESSVQNARLFLWLCKRQLQLSQDIVAVWWTRSRVHAEMHVFVTSQVSRAKTGQLNHQAFQKRKDTLLSSCYCSKGTKRGSESFWQLRWFIVFVLSADFPKNGGP